MKKEMYKEAILKIATFDDERVITENTYLSVGDDNNIGGEEDLF